MTLPTILSRLFKRLAPPAIIHDYATTRTWGHDYLFRPFGDGIIGRITGWGDGIAAGHFLLLENKASKSGVTLYRVDTIKYAWDPPDMWWATVSFTKELPSSYRVMR